MKKLIDIPSNDLRKYGYGILENKVKYVLVNDDKIDVSSVCVAVKTGSINDPIKYQEENEAHGHSHDNDLPSKILNIIFMPVLVLAVGFPCQEAAWHMLLR